MGATETAAARAQARVGSTLNGKWRLDALLGIGGMAAVYAATHRNGNRAAVKVLHTELSVDAALVARFLREGYLANRVAHPGAVNVLDDARAEDGSSFLVMELLEGYSLERHTQGPETAMPLPTVLQVADQLLDVLAAAHAVGIVHRDIKPANLFLTRDGRLKVLDFGIARIAEPLLDGAVTQTGAAIGTPAYMPPEQARGRWAEVDARTDLWAVGASMLALVIGHRPRRAATAQEDLLLAMTERLPPASSLLPDLPDRVARVIDRSVAFARGHRFPDARSMQLELRRAMDAAAVASSPTLVIPGIDTAPVVHPGALARAAEPVSSPSSHGTGPHAPSSSAAGRAPPARALPAPIETPPTTGRPMWVAPVASHVLAFVVGTL
jgi:serine/threonine-protein kinase